MKNTEKRTQNGPKRTCRQPIISSYAFYRSSFSYSVSPFAGSRAAMDDPEKMQQRGEGLYQSSELTVHITAESDLSYGRAAEPEPFVQLLTTYQGRTYSLTFEQWLSADQIRRRAFHFSAQVVAMAQYHIRRLEYRAPAVAPKGTAPAGWPQQQPELFDGGHLSRAHHLDDVQALLTMLQAAAAQGEAALLNALAHAQRANAGLRKFYGIPATTQTATTV